jgi:hypothetical protein
MWILETSALCRSSTRYGVAARRREGAYDNVRVQVGQDRDDPVPVFDRALMMLRDAR